MSYTSLQDQVFSRIIKQKENDYEDGPNIPSNLLMGGIVTKYNSCK